MTPTDKTMNINLTGPDFTRLANNFYNSKGLDSYQQRINTDADLLNYFFANHDKVKDKKKVAFVWICLNPPYWQFAKRMIEGAKQFFLPGHEVDYFLWSDIPETREDIKKKILEVAQPNLDVMTDINQYKLGIAEIEQTLNDADDLRKMPRTIVFPLESVEWPFPTLMRYHTFLQQEDILSKYDYIFYCDVDMMFVDIVGDEILGADLTASVNPMYYLDSTLYPPYEPNELSQAYIPRPSRIVQDKNSSAGKRLQPLYYAGGFQGGRADKFIEAMKVIKERIDKDLRMDYIAIWNEESHWNKYLFENPPSVVLNPSYIYPDSLIKEYYEPRWGRPYQPKLVTLTKKFSLRKLSLEEQAQLTMMQNLSK